MSKNTEYSKEAAVGPGLLGAAIGTPFGLTGVGGGIGYAHGAKGEHKDKLREQDIANKTEKELNAYRHKLKMQYALAGALGASNFSVPAGITTGLFLGPGVGATAAVLPILIAGAIARGSGARAAKDNEAAVVREQYYRDQSSGSKTDKE
jgi:hypothetical protein